MEKTIAAISTATGEAGIGIVRMSGEKAFEIADKVFKPANSTEFHNRKMTYGHIEEEGQLIDEVLISYMKGPKTYTTEDMVEIYTHGGIISVRKVLALLLKKGADTAGPGEFTKRAFLNGRLDLSQAEAVIDMIQAKTEKAYDASLEQLEGSLQKEIYTIRQKLLDILAHIEYSINFLEDGQEELEDTIIEEKGREILEDLERLYLSSNQGKIVREGIQTTIVGKPNVGKSSLLNALIRENKAIVTDIPGTTRDVIEEYIDLGGFALKIVDTAGIRETEDVVESLGVNKSLEFIERADLVIALFDASRVLDQEDRQILELLKNRKSIIVLNKSDLEKKWVKEELGLPEDTAILELSVLKGEGIGDLEDKILSLFYEGEVVQKSDVLVTNVRHRDLIGKAIESMERVLNDYTMGIPIDCLEVDVKSTWEILGEITGETIEDDVLDKIFKEFCVGK
ncbi:tRNA uridine-5-carboxymethylaminomethyl(34) synthesis GTPase MnmE [Gallicola sp. Sow4_E12]|uniref:tRNA uridine-5-carboxymethylaminomethyl(34) synthesis GTPase MnmE n=1 Tax=Gallicola sp. Sow4_E12 TaxID=3438785 RepID=UPI003F8DED20